MAAQKQGMVFYEPSSSGYCVYYLSRDCVVANPLRLTSGMPFVKAAEIVHELNDKLFQLFQKGVVNDEEIKSFVSAYLMDRDTVE